MSHIMIKMVVFTYGFQFLLLLIVEAVLVLAWSIVILKLRWKD